MVRQDRGMAELSLLVSTIHQVLITELTRREVLGGIFHVITYGKGAMGAHASQLNKIERWKVAMYVRTLQHGGFNLEGLAGPEESDSSIVDINNPVAVVDTIAPTVH